MTYPTQPPVDAGPQVPPPQTFWQRFGRWIGIAAGIVVAVAGLARLLGAFTLPSCDSSRMADTLRSIVREQKLELKKISDIKTVSSSSSEITCTAVIETGGDRQPISFRSYWKGWSAQVSLRGGLPFCDSPGAEVALRNIFKDRKIAVDRIFGFKTVSTSDAENVCTAQVEAPTETAAITFRIFRKDAEMMYQITDAKSQPKQ